MQDGLYVALSAQIALEQRLTTIADNLANVNTTGFRATGIKFEEVVSGLTSGPAAFVSDGDSFLPDRAGEVVATGNSLDFAVQGDAWFAISTPEGTVMTRDGRFSMQPTGELVSVNGYPVLDPGGSPIQLDPGGSKPEVGRDGFLRQDGRQLGAIGLYAFTPEPNFRRFENSGVIPSAPPEPIVDRNDVGVLQGFVENSNVNPIKELTNLITVQRAFDSVAALIKDGDRAIDMTVRALEQ